MATYPEIIETPYPFQHLLGFQIVEWTPELVEIHLPLHEALGNRYGIPHGGVHATLLDTVMGFSGCFTGSAENTRQAMTLSLNVSYLSRPKGEILIATGRKIGGGNRTFFAEAEIRDETEELIATGSGTFRYRSS
jgi:uncharacterized protein (TIGR00369 family)